MEETWNRILWAQLGGALDMLGNAIEACPPDVWSDPSKKPEWIDNGVPGFWYLVFHTLFWTDYYLSDSTEGFHPPAPFNLDEMDPAGLLPERPYPKDELLRYLEHCQQKGLAAMSALTPERALRPSTVGRSVAPFLETLLYNMRHIQHHTAQLNLLLRQQTNSAPKWVARSRRELDSTCVNWKV